MMKICKGGVAQPKGFKANGLCCGIKRSGKYDLGLITCEKPVASAAVFTRNSVKAAPLVLTQKHLRNSKAQAIIVNSGNANCFTGNFGRIYAQRTAELIAKLLKIKTQDVIVASTGIIGKALPYKKIQKAAKNLVAGLSVRHSQKAAKAILTTDTRIKEAVVHLVFDGKKITLGACAKGSGMIAPNMATMLAFVTTDAAINPRLLKQALKKAVEKSFNCITVDGCMSTNDMVTIMASGLAKNRLISKADKRFEQFAQALENVCLDLAKKIVLDGEGATKFVKVTIQGAKSEKQAKDIGLTIANSNLVKTAAHGSNPNWGRVAAAVGSLSIKGVNEDNLKIEFGSFSKKNIAITVKLNLGHKQAEVFTSDLSYEYVRINGQYN